MWNILLQRNIAIVTECPKIKEVNLKTHLDTEDLHGFALIFIKRTIRKPRMQESYKFDPFLLSWLLYRN